MKKKNDDDVYYFFAVVQQSILYFSSSTLVVAVACCLLVVVIIIIVKCGVKQIQSNTFYDRRRSVYVCVLDSFQLVDSVDRNLFKSKPPQFVKNC